MLTNVDFENNIAFTDKGGMLAIESYEDKHGDPCDIDEARYISVVMGNSSRKTYDLWEILDYENLEE